MFGLYMQKKAFPYDAILPGEIHGKAPCFDLAVALTLTLLQVV